MNETPPVAGWRPRALARRYCVSVNKVLAWIKRGELFAINTADRLGERPQYLVTPEALADFERRRQATTPKAPKPRRRKHTGEKDYFPD